MRLLYKFQFLSMHTRYFLDSLLALQHTTLQEKHWCSHQVDCKCLKGTTQTSFDMDLLDSDMLHKCQFAETGFSRREINIEKPKSYKSIFHNVRPCGRLLLHWSRILLCSWNAHVAILLRKMDKLYLCAVQDSPCGKKHIWHEELFHFLAPPVVEFQCTPKQLCQNPILSFFCLHLFSAFITIDVGDKRQRKVTIPETSGTYIPRFPFLATYSATDWTTRSFLQLLVESGDHDGNALLFLRLINRKPLRTQKDAIDSRTKNACFNLKWQRA